MHFKTTNLVASALSCLAVMACCSLWAQPAGQQFERELPDYFIPGWTLTVVLRGPSTLARATVEEIIPPRWSPSGLESSRWFFSFDESSGTITWHLDIEATVPEGFWFSYKVTPPPDYGESATFDGRARSSIPTVGDSVIYPRSGNPLYKPAWATIQATVDSCLWGDTVMVLAAQTPFAENVVMKPGVDLVGFVDSPFYEPVSYDPPLIEAASADEPAITAAAYCKISGFVIRSAGVGIRVLDPTVEISNCLIIGTSTAGIEYVGTTEGKITNCTIVDNEGVGVLCHEPSPNVVVSNSIFVGNGGKDVENCTAGFSLLQDEIEPGSGENNISGDPMFVNPYEGDYRLLRGSPCIDAGDNSSIAGDAVDILSKPRILFGGSSQTVDMGAYEFWMVEARLEQHSPAQMAVTWASCPGKTYTVLFSPDLITWEIAAEGLPSAGATTTWLDAARGSSSSPAGFYKVGLDE
ncbi:MAG: right-handed parallel beta-helix repeat-containing protein [bacterium]|nr:right-handed parallel beta-helix repeat-containing protein [bacterium]